VGPTIAINPIIQREDIMTKDHFVFENIDQIEELESKIAPSGAAALVDHTRDRGGKSR
jgi:hypothetical protein